LIALFAGALLAATGSADAHVLESTGAGLAAGFAHPFTGLDHLAATALLHAVGIGIYLIARAAIHTPVRM